MSKTVYEVQYQDPYGDWKPCCDAFDVYGEALDRFYQEASRDVNFDHRVVRQEVLSYVTKGGYRK